jgi:RNA polymerase sigma-70 factor (ECF subfamily)
VTVLSEIKARFAELSPELEHELATQLAAARARWPQAPEPDASFVELVIARLASPRIEDLYLAWWCRSGDASAITAFEAAFDDELRATTTRFRELPTDELRQLLRIKLFVGTPDSPPKIRDYSGTGSLKSWLRVTAVRLFIDVMRSTRVERTRQDLDDVELLNLTDPQGRSISAELGAAVKAAFAGAVATLAPRQRVFLRHAYVDHHTLDQIAAHYSVHRTTVARTLATAREQLIAETRTRLTAACGIEGEELASVIRMLDSRIDLSLSRVLDRE